MSADVLTIGGMRNVKPELAEAKGKRLIISAESEEGVRMPTSVMKQLASTDQIYAEKKYKAPLCLHTVAHPTSYTRTTCPGWVQRMRASGAGSSSSRLRPRSKATVTSRTMPTTFTSRQEA